MDPTPTPHCGLLNLNKPAGITSRHAVDIVQRLTRPTKAGHAGTLDPLATGVLVLCLGHATRLIEYIQRMPKQYVGTFLLGRQSATEDIEGDVTELPAPPIPTREQIEAAAQRFVGQINQRPPAFSALKIQGRPSYKLARQGKPVELAPRPVQIHRIEVKAYEYPEFVLEIDCGSGTYVRSLGRDLAESLGTAAVMSALVRTSIGPFRLAEAVDPRTLHGDNWPSFVQSPLRAVDYLPQVELSTDAAARLRNGLAIELSAGWHIPEQNVGWHVPERSEGRGLSRDQTVGWDKLARSHRRPERIEGRGLSSDQLPEELVAIDSTGQLIGVLAPSGPGQWRTLRNMPYPTA